MSKKNKNPDRGHVPNPVLWLKQSSLRTKVTVFAIAIGVLPILGVGIVEFLQDKQLLKDKLVKEQEAQTALLADGFSRFMSDRYGTAQVIANLEVLSDPQVIAATSLRQKQDELNQFIKAFGVYDNITFADLTGKVTLEVGVHATDNISNTAYFKEALKAKVPIVTHPEKAMVTGLQSVFISAPVMERETGKTLGVVSMRMPVNRITEFFIQSNPSLKKEEHLFIDENGVIFDATEREDVGKSASSLFPELAPLLQANQLDTVMVTDPVGQAQLLASYAPLHSGDGTPKLKWSILLAQSTAVLQAARLRLLFVYLGAIGLTILITGAIAAWLARRATKPLLQAAHAVEDLSEGKLTTRLEIHGKDELAILAHNINCMADQFQALAKSQRSGHHSLQNLGQLLSQIEQAAVKTSASVDLDRELVDQLANQANHYTDALNHILSSLKDIGRSLDSIVHEARTSTVIPSIFKTSPSTTAEQATHHLVALQEAIHEATHIAKRGGEHSQQLSATVSSVQEIAHRANLLAVNSSIMATRSDDSEDQDLAVVAIELGEMAAHSAEIAQQLQRVANGIQHESLEVSKALESSIAHVAENTHFIEDSQQTLGKLSEVAHQIDQFVQSIVNSAEAQSRSTYEVAHSLTELRQFPQQNHDRTLQISRSLEKTAIAVQQLQAAIQAVKLEATAETPERA